MISFRKCLLITYCVQGKRDAAEKASKDQECTRKEGKACVLWMGSPVRKAVAVRTGKPF